MLYKITYYVEFEKFYCFVVASSEEEAIKRFHKEITDREPEKVSKCSYDISVMRAPRR